MRKDTLKKVLTTLKPYRFAVGLSVVFSFLMVVGSLLLPILIGKGVDCILTSGQVDFEQLNRILVMMILTLSLSGIFAYIQNALNNHVVAAVTFDIRTKAFNSLLTVPIAYLDRHLSGDIVSRIVSDVDQFSDGLMLGTTQIFTGVLTIVGTLVFMFCVNPIMAGVVLLLTPLSILLSRFIAKNTHRYFEKQADCRGTETAFINEVVENEKLVKAYGREEDMKARFEIYNENLREASEKAVFYSALVNPSTRFVYSLIYVALCGVGAVFAFSNTGFTIGVLTTFLAYTDQYTKPFNEISGIIAELQNALVCAKRIFDLIELPGETQGEKKFPEQCMGKVEFKNVQFAYDENQPVICDFNLVTEPGKHVAIVGSTGCGKTTLINLLMRFYDPDSGTILLDGENIADYRRDEYRRHLGMVLQNTWIQSGTIRENIAMGKPNADFTEIQNAAKITKAHSFIKRLEKGYDTYLPEGGGDLSEGERQLLCITRLVLAPPEILILDEATSSIDTRTEMEIQNALDKIMEGRTSFIVAHRLSTIQNADLILVMEHGQIVEKGTHQELLKQEGVYKKLYESQFMGVNRSW